MTANYNIAYHETILDILRTRLNDDVIIPQMESLNDPHIAAFNGAIQARRDLKRSAFCKFQGAQEGHWGRFLGSKEFLKF